jgi:hypothetical protein
MNCAVVGMFNDAFRADYVKRYFDFVLDAPGEVLFATEGSREMYPWCAAQIVAEQWLLAAVADFWKYSKGTPIRTQAVCKAIWASERFFPLDMDLPSENADTSSFFHLWGAKAHQDQRGSAQYREMMEFLIRHRRFGGGPRSGPVKHVLENLMSDN